jgi:hypothetical protein
VDGRLAASSDRIADTVDYASVVDDLRVSLAQQRHRLLERLAESVTGPLASGINAAQAALGTALVFYVPWYLLRAMRRVYAQSWWKTLPKVALLGLAYFFSLVFTGIGLLAYTALTL